MAGRRAAWAGLLGGLAALGLALGATVERPPSELPGTELDATASDVAELLDALNRTQGSDKSLTITLLGGRQLPLALPIAPGDSCFGIQPSALLSSTPSCHRDWKCQAPRPRLLSTSPHCNATPSLNQTAACLPVFLPAADDMYLSPQDIRTWRPWLPFDGGNRTMVLRGAGGSVVLDFGRWAGTMVMARVMHS